MRRQQEPVSDPATATAAAVAAAGVAVAGSPSGAAKQEGCEPTPGAEKVIPTENNAAADRKSDDKGSCVDDQLLWYRRPVFIKIVIPVTLSVLLLIVAGGLQAVSGRRAEARSKLGLDQGHTCHQKMLNHIAYFIGFKASYNVREVVCQRLSRT